MTFLSLEHEFERITTDELYENKQLSVNAYKACSRALMYSQFDIFIYYKNGGRFSNIEYTTPDVSEELEDFCRNIDRNLKLSSPIIYSNNEFIVLNQVYNGLNLYQKAFLELIFQRYLHNQIKISCESLKQDNLSVFFEYTLNCLVCLQKVLDEGQINEFAILRQKNDNEKEISKIQNDRFVMLRHKIESMNKIQLRFAIQQLADKSLILSINRERNTEELSFNEFFSFTTSRLDLFFKLLQQLGINTRIQSILPFESISLQLKAISKLSEKEIFLYGFIQLYSKKTQIYVRSIDYYHIYNYLPMFRIIQDYFSMEGKDRIIERRNSFKILKRKSTSSAFTTNQVSVVKREKLKESFFNESGDYLRYPQMWSGYNHLLKYEVLSKNSEVIRREITEKEGTSLKPTYILDLLSVILIDDFLFLKVSGIKRAKLKSKYLVKRELEKIFDFSIFLSDMDILLKKYRTNFEKLSLNNYLSTSKARKSNINSKRESIKKVLIELLNNEYDIRIDSNECIVFEPSLGDLFDVEIPQTGIELGLSSREWAAVELVRIEDSITKLLEQYNDLCPIKEIVEYIVKRIPTADAKKVKSVLTYDLDNRFVQPIVNYWGLSNKLYIHDDKPRRVSDRLTDADKKVVFRIIRKQGKPMTLPDIYNQYIRINPNCKSKQAVHAYLSSSKLIVYLWNFSAYALKEWKMESPETRREIIEEFLMAYETPMSIKLIRPYVDKFQPTYAFEIRYFIATDKLQRFSFFADGTVGLKSKQYDDSFIVGDINDMFKGAEGKNKTVLLQEILKQKGAPMSPDEIYTKYKEIKKTEGYKTEDEIKKALSNCKKIHYSHIVNVYAMKEWKVDIPFTISDVIIDYLNKQDIPQTTEEIKEGVELVRFEYCSEMRKKIKDEKRDLFCYFENERIGLKTKIYDPIYVQVDKETFFKPKFDLDLTKTLKLILKRNGKPMHRKDILSEYLKIKPNGLIKNEKQINDALKRVKDIASVRYTGVYVLREWGLKETKTIGELAVDFLSDINMPKSINEILESVRIVFPSTSFKNLYKVLRTDKQKRFVQFQDRTIGLSNKSYAVDYIVEDWANLLQERLDSSLVRYLPEILKRVGRPMSRIEIMEEYNKERPNAPIHNPDQLYSPLNSNKEIVHLRFQKLYALADWKLVDEFGTYIYYAKEYLETKNYPPSLDDIYSYVLNFYPKMRKSSFKEVLLKWVPSVLKIYKGNRFGLSFKEYDTVYIPSTIQEFKDKPLISDIVAKILKENGKPMDCKMIVKAYNNTNPVNSIKYFSEMYASLKRYDKVAYLKNKRLVALAEWGIEDDVHD